MYKILTNYTSIFKKIAAISGKSVITKTKKESNNLKINSKKEV